MKILQHVDLTLNELRNALAHILASDPGSPAEGQMWYNSTTHRWMYRDNSANIDMRARANHTGTQLAATISDFATTVQATRLDQLAAPTASVSLNSQKITNLLDGNSAQDAVTYNQLQTVLNGRSFKDAVRVATTANITLSGTQTIDGISVIAGDRVLVKNQTTAANNGIYVCASGAWSRATDADSAAKLVPNTSVFVSEGTTQQDTQWTLATNAAITLGTTALTFSQTGSGTTYTQGTGVTISGGVISADHAVVPFRYAANVGDGTSTSIAVTHSLGTLDVHVQVFQNSDGATVLCDVARNSTSQVTLSFVTAPASNALRVVVFG